MTNKNHGLSIATDVTATIELIGKFGALLEKETTALNNADYKSVDGLQDEKKTMAKNYQSHIECLHRQRADIINIDLSLREKLISARTRFTDILKNNLKALDLAKTSSRRLVDRILEAARNAATEDRTNAYTSRGKMAVPTKGPISISVNRQL